MLYFTMIFIAKVTENGRITIPAKLRKRYKLKKGTRILIFQEGKRLYLQPVPDFFSLQGIIKNKKVYTIRELEDRYINYLANRKK